MSTEQQTKLKVSPEMLSRPATKEPKQEPSWTEKGKRWLQEMWGKLWQNKSHEVLEGVAEASEHKDELVVDIPRDAVEDTPPEARITKGQPEIATPTLEEAAEVERLPYITETLARVEASSAKELESFFDSDWVLSSVAFAVKETAQIETIVDELPNLKSEAEALIPSPEDWKYAQVRPEDWSAALKGTLRTRARRELVKKASSILREKFDAEVRSRTEKEARELVSTARKEAENFTGEGSVLVISTTPKDVLAILDSGRYTPSLDRENLGWQAFNDYAKGEIQSRLTLDPNSEEFEVRFKGLSHREQRYLREIELGIYPSDGEKQNVPHPVYGQMVVDETVELERVSQQGYGTVHLRFRTERIKDRTTFLTGDSLNNWKDNHQLSWAEAVKARKFLNTLAESPGVDWRALPPYIEAHIMDGAGIEDIEGCLLAPNETTKALETYFQTHPDQFSITQREDDKMWIQFSSATLSSKAENKEMEA